MLSKSEFASLSDLALSKGVSHSDLISEINQRVLLEYKKQYSEKAKTVEVFVNEESGEVKLMKDREDVTPKEFKLVAEKLARSIIIEKLNYPDADLKVSEVKKETKKESKIGLFIISLIFWGYNLVYVFSAFVFIVNFFFEPGFKREILDSIKNLGVFGTSFVITAVMTPFLSVFTAWRLIAGKNYNKIGILFFFFEVPVVIVSLFFSSTFTSPTPFMWFLFVMTLCGLPVVLMYLLNYKVESLNLQRFVLFLRESLFLLFTYFAVVFSFFTPLIIGFLGKSVFEFITDNFLVRPYSYSHYFNPVEILLTIFFGGLYIIFMLALAAIPYFLAIFFAKIFLSARNYLQEKYEKENVDRLTLIFALVWFFFFAVSSYQPNAQKYIKRLEQLKALQSFEEREQIAKELMPSESKIRRVLDDLQNVRSRYLMSKSDDIIKDAYIEELNFNQISASLLQDTFDFIAYPFVYQGNVDKESQALSNFEYLFGDSYLTKNYTSPEVKNVDLLSRKVNVSLDPSNIAAAVSVEEEYRSKISRDQEVIYEFSLPGDSAITDLKLGPNLEFTGTIAPKGAAATTYQREVNRSRDPALLEETGPNQYRLRVFPIPGTTNRSLLSGKNQKIQFTYNTFLTQKGFSLPLYTKSQNVETAGLRPAVFIDGNEAQENDNYITSSSIKETVKSICLNKSENALGFNFGHAALFLAPNIALEKVQTGYKCSENTLDITPSAKGMKIAVLLDSAYADKENSEISSAKKILKESGNFVSDNEIDIYKFNDIVSKPVKLTNENIDDLFKITFFGKSNWVHAANWVREFGNENKVYDFVILITDSNDTAIVKGESLYKNAPVLVVHDKAIPPYTTKLTGEIIQTGGNSFNNFSDALNSGILESMDLTSFGKSVISVGPFYSFLSDTAKKDLLEMPGWHSTLIDKVSPISRVFAKNFLDEKIHAQTGNLDGQISFLDQINAFAVNNSVVSPYSSLIALVNETQVKNLLNQSQSLDRYKDTSTPSVPQRISNPSFGPMDSFFGVNTLSLDGGGGGGGGFGKMAAPSGISSGGISIGAGGQFAPLRSFDGISAFIFINVLLLGGGILIFVISKIKLRRKKQ